MLLSKPFSSLVLVSEAPAMPMVMPHGRSRRQHGPGREELLMRHHSRCQGPLAALAITSCSPAPLHMAQQGPVSNLQQQQGQVI